jgi:CDP-4-dehydro-6-deoxyglucose reductase
MPSVTFKDKVFDCDNEKSVLQNILSQGSFMPYSCQAGLCHACLSKAVKGNVPEASQEGLSQSLKDQNCFLSCLCQPSEDLEIELATKDNVTFETPGISAFDSYTTTVIDRSWLNDDVLRLFLVRPEPLA